MQEYYTAATVNGALKNTLHMPWQVQDYYITAMPTGTHKYITYIGEVNAASTHCFDEISSGLNA